VCAEMGSGCGLLQALGTFRYPVATFKRKFSDAAREQHRIRISIRVADER